MFQTQRELNPSCVFDSFYRVDSARLIVGAHGFKLGQADGRTLKGPPPGDTTAHWRLVPAGQ